MGRKDRERFRQLRENDPNYVGYRGTGTSTLRSRSSDTETVICSSCQRKRNVVITSLPENASEYICMSCLDGTAQSL